MLSGPWAAQRDDYTGITRPDAMILLSREGASRVGRQLAARQPEDRVFALPDVADVKTKATVRVIDPAQAPMRLGAGQVAL